MEAIISSARLAGTDVIYLSIYLSTRNEQPRRGHSATEREREREKYYTYPALRLIQVLPGHPLADSNDETVSSHDIARCIVSIVGPNKPEYCSRTGCRAVQSKHHVPLIPNNTRSTLQAGTLRPWDPRPSTRHNWQSVAPRSKAQENTHTTSTNGQLQK